MDTSKKSKEDQREKPGKENFIILKSSRIRNLKDSKYRMSDKKVDLNELPDNVKTVLGTQ